LAIAGLIFLMVFIALPALQRNQRDTARKSDVAIVASGVVAYTGNNRGKFPDSGTLASYVKDHSDNTTSVAVNGTVGKSSLSSDTTGDGIITVTESTTCGDSTGSVGGNPATQTLLAGTTRQFTVVTLLESGGGAYFCQNG